MPRRPLGLVPTIVLGQLVKGPKHPYEILRLVREHHDDRATPVSVGAVYHAVDRLEADGLVRAVGSVREGSRPERTVYAATDEGRREHLDRVRELLASTGPEPEFQVGLAQADLLEADEVATLLRARRDALGRTLAQVRGAVDGVLEAGVPHRYVLDLWYELEQLSSQVAWLGRTAQQIDDGLIDWTAAAPATVPAAPDPGATATHEPETPA